MYGTVSSRMYKDIYCSLVTRLSAESARDTVQDPPRPGFQDKLQPLLTDRQQSLIRCCCTTSLITVRFDWMQTCTWRGLDRSANQSTFHSISRGHRNSCLPVIPGS